MAVTHNVSGEVGTRFSRGRGVGAAALGVLPAWLVGVVVMSAHAAPPRMPIVNTVAVLVGMVTLATAGGAIGRAVRERPGWVGWGAVALLGLTLAFEPMDGVHRWVRLGPVGLHASAMVGPVALLCVAASMRARRWLEAGLVIAAIGAIHVVQPDAGQGTSLAAGVIVIVARTDGPRLVRGAGIAIAVAGAAAAWGRPDPLAAVPWVEDAIPRAFAQSVVGGVAAVLALAALPGAVLLGTRERSGAFGATEALALAAYFVATVVVTFVGCFPTPVLGFGASPILGAIVGIGVLRGMVSVERCP